MDFNVRAREVGAAIFYDSDGIRLTCRTTSKSAHVFDSHVAQPFNYASILLEDFAMRATPRA
eukprot:3436846-Pyramimonas_sp.AAC.1